MTMRRTTERGQTMVELALVLPLFLMLIFGIIILGIGVFYQQQITNAAREAARYAAIHTATAQCPTVSRHEPAAPPQTYYRCDAPEGGWPLMTAAGRSFVFGLPSSQVNISACWSGYTDPGRDAGPRNLTTGAANAFAPCFIGGVNPRTNPSGISCPAPTTTTTDDKASSMSASNGLMANEVTVYACYTWQPPLAGFLLLPQTVDLRSVATEKLEYQQ